MAEARKACHDHKHSKWGVSQLCTFHFIISFHFMHPNVDLSKACTGDLLVWAELLIRQGGHVQGMHSRRFTQELCVHVHAVSNAVWGCDSVPLGETLPRCPVSELIANRLLALCQTARISDLIWKEALVDDLVLPAARWTQYVFLLMYTGAFNLLL